MRKRRSYKPEPISTDGILIPDELAGLIETLAKDCHDRWAHQRMAEKWRYGSSRNDSKKTHPCLVPYEELSEQDKEYDRLMARETLRLVIKFGYSIVKNPACTEDP